MGGPSINQNCNYLSQLSLIFYSKCIMTPRHYINTMIVIFIVNNNINEVFDIVYEMLYGLHFFIPCLFRVVFFIIILEGSSVG